MQISSTFIEKTKDMKRFLSILLIAAAVFGVYADILNVKDAFACKSYWEEKSDKAEADLNMLAAGLKTLKKDKKTYLKGVKTVAKSRKALARSEATYNAASGKLSKAKKQLKTGKKEYKKLVDFIKSISTLRTTYAKTWKSPYDALCKERASIVSLLKAPAPDISPSGDTVRGVIYGYRKFITPETDKKAFEDAVKALYSKDLSAVGFKDYASYCNTVADAIDKLIKEQEAVQASAGSLAACKTDDELADALKNSPELYNAAIGLVSLDIVAEDDPKAVVDGAANGSELDLETVKFCATEPMIKEELTTSVKNLKWLKHYVTDKMRTHAGNINAKVDNLLAVQDQVAVGVSNVCKTIYKNKEYKKGVKKLMGKNATQFLEEYRKNPNILSTSQATFPMFEEQMDKNPGIAAILEKAQTYLNKERTKALTAYKKANTKYKRSLTTYKKTPAKLESARKKLATAEAKLTKYEDGEKAARKGLKDLMASEGEGGVESVADRVGDAGFDDKSGKLDPGKGLDAVSAGEDYLNEVGDMVTKELTNRFIATALGVIAAALALLAGLLSLLRSNRGGAVISCFAAITGAAAAVYGNDAGTVFSEIAGSEVGALPWIGAAVIAGVSLAFAAMHFAAKIEEK